ncbi:MAG: Eco57I restriction-modification methylase domain-containing protein, partial [Candidatus Paceibacteria bacterium]
MFIDDYDVVVSNPPYLGSAKMEDTLKQFIKDNFKSSQDLYTAFIERCLELADNGGYVTMVTPENFMFLSSYEGVRENLVSDTQIIEGAHVSRYGFDQAKDSYTIPFVLRNKDPSDFTSSRFYRMTHNQKEYAHYEDKIRGLKSITKANRRGETHSDVYSVDQNSFKDIDGYPFVYWFGNEVLSLFQKHPKLGENEISRISGGIKSGDNPHFLRKYWEIPESWIGESHRWFVKGGDGNDFYDKIDMTIRWEDGGQNIIEYCEEHGKNYQGLSNTEWYSEESITFRDFSNIFVAKRLPKDTMFSSSVYRIKPNTVSEPYLLGYMNSTLFRYLADAMNPSMNFKPSDAGAVPIDTNIPSEEEEKIGSLVRKCIKKRKGIFRRIESGRDFNGEYLISVYEDECKYPLYDDELKLSDLLILHGKLDDIIFYLYSVPSRIKQRIYDDFYENLTTYTHITNAGS